MLKIMWPPELCSALFSPNGINAICIPLQVKPRDPADAFAGIRRASNLDYGPEAVAKATAA